MGRLGKLPMGEQPSYNAPICFQTPYGGWDSTQPRRGHTASHRGQHGAVMRAPLIACRDEPDAQLFSLRLGVLPCGGELQFRQLPFTMTVAGLPEG